MKIFVLLILFCFFTTPVFSQTDSSQSTSSGMILGDEFGFNRKDEPVSVAGAVSFSILLPGAGLFLTDNEGPAIAYISVTSFYYTLGLVFLFAGETANDGVALPLFGVGIGVHFVSIIHTLISTLKYNEDVSPYISYNGKMCQLGLSIKF